MRLLTLAAALVTLALPAHAEISVGEISQYLNSFRTAQSAFTQVNADGTISTGDLTIARPGKARFDYDAPNKGLVVAGGQQVAIFDPVSNQPPEQYPLSQTPLSLILEAQVNPRPLRHGRGPWRRRDADRGDAAGSAVSRIRQHQAGVHARPR